MNKLNQFNAFLISKGFRLNSLSGVAYLIRRSFEFIIKYKKDFLHVLNEKIQTQSMWIPTVEEIETFGSHNHIMNKTSPQLVDYAKMKWAGVNLTKRYSFTAIILITGIRDVRATISTLEKQVCGIKQICFVTEFADRLDIGVEDELRFSEKNVSCHIFKKIDEAIENVISDYIFFLCEGDLLKRDTLFQIQLEINRKDENPVMVYTDHDYIYKDKKETKIILPYFKPDWSPDLFSVNNYIYRAMVFRKDFLSKAYKTVSTLQEVNKLSLFIYEMALSLLENKNIIHVSGIYFTFPYFKNPDDYNKEEDVIRQKAIRLRDKTATITINKYYATAIERSLHGNPKISIIIPTCFKDHYITNCLESIKEKTTYKNYEIIVIDNSRRHPKFGQDRLKQFNCKVLYIHEPFNFSRLNNLAVKEAIGDLYLFLNDDIEIITPDWLERMAVEALRPEIAMVGPLLLFPDRKVQSAGVFLVNHGGGGRSFFLNEPEDSVAYHNMLHYRRECSFVIGACIMIQKQKFQRIGGFDERFPLVGNEMEFGLRLRKSGYRNLYIPEVQLFHKEKASRKNMDESSGDKLIWEVLGNDLEQYDPYFNSLLDNSKNTPEQEVNPVIFRYPGSPSLPVENIKKIIIIKLDHIGDVILSLPAIRKIRALFPDARIDVLCAPFTKEILEMQPEIDNIKTFSFFDQRSQLGVRQGNSENILQLIESLKSEHYDLSIHLRKDEETKDIAFEAADFCLAYSGAAEEDRIQYALPSLKNIGRLRPKWSNSDQLMLLAKTMDYTGDFYNELYIDSDIRKSVEEKTRSLMLDFSHLTIGIHVGAGGNFKKWPLKYFIRLCNLILTRTDANIILFGGKDEIEENEIILKEVKAKVRIKSVAGAMSLKEYCALVQKVNYFIGNDSGPKHIAAIQGVPTLTINGSTSEQEWASIGQNNMSVRKCMNCHPCYFYLEEHCPNKECMNRLYPYDVFLALEKLILLFPHKREVLP